MTFIFRFLSSCFRYRASGSLVFCLLSLTPMPSAFCAASSLSAVEGDGSGKLSESADYKNFLASVRAEALERGIISGADLDDALKLAAHPNPRVIRSDHSQPEFSLDWERYSALLITPDRIGKGLAVLGESKADLLGASHKYGVDPGVILGIWGLESEFGEKSGNYNVIGSLATLAYEGRRARFFRSELMDALAMVGRGWAHPEQMKGSYAGAMGQPQFMPSAYLQHAVSAEGGRRADIWTSRADVFASIAHYLGHFGWKQGEPWGEAVRLPSDSGGKTSCRPAGNYRSAQPCSVREWKKLGVSRISGKDWTRGELSRSAVLVQPDGARGKAFLLYPNFEVVRSYNPSDFYALAVSLLGEKILTAAGLKAGSPAHKPAALAN